MGLWDWTKSAFNTVADAGDAMTDWASRPAEEAPATEEPPAAETAFATEEEKGWFGTALGKVTSIPGTVGTVFSAAGGLVVTVGDKIGQGVATTIYEPEKIGSAIVHYKNFVRDDPGGFLKYGTQGLVNGVTSTIGLVGDLAVAGVRLGTPVGWVATIHNLGAEDEDKWTLGLPKFGGCAEGLTELCEFTDPPSEYVMVTNSDGSVEPKRHPAGHPQQGELVRDPYYMCKSVTKNTVQGVIEIGVVVATAVPTAGASAAAIGGARAAAAGARVALSGTKAGRAVTTAASAVGRHALIGPAFGKVAGVVAKPGLSASGNFNNAAKATYRWIKPWTRRDDLLKELNDKKGRLVDAGMDFEKAGRVTRLNSFGRRKTHWRRIANISEDIDKLSARMASRQAAGKGPGIKLTRMDAIPEVIGLKMVAGTGIYGDWAHDRQNTATVTSAERDNENADRESAQDLLDEFGSAPDAFGQSFADSSAPHPAQRPDSSPSDIANFAFSNYTYRQPLSTHGFAQPQSEQAPLIKSTPFNFT